MEASENAAANGPSSTIRQDYRTIQDLVFTTLRDEILSGELEPGERLNTSQLSERLGVSRTPIREALNRLTSIGLVENIPHRGAFVRKLSIEEIIEIYYIRAALEGIAARLAARNLKQEEIQQLLHLCDGMESHLSTGNYQKILETNFAFHNTIYQAAQSPRLQNLILQYYSQSEQYRALGLELPGRYSEICQEHRNLALALARRDVEAAELQAREHHLNTARRIAKSVGRDVQI
jgi:DNA-binding GntR family transcriptional regulator